MKKLISIILLLSGLGCYAQPSFVPEDLSYDFRISKEDLGIKGNVKTVSQSNTRTSTASPNIIGIVLYGYFDFNIYEEGRDVYYDNNFMTPIFPTLKDGGFTCEFARSSNYVESIRWTYKPRHHGYIYPEMFFDYHYKYDSDNKVVSVITDGDYKKSFFFKYENGLLVEKEVNSFNNEVVYPTTYKYDSNGRVVEVITIPTCRGKKNGNPSIRSYSYSEEGDKIKVKSTCSNVKLVLADSKRNRNSEWIYDKNGKLLESEIYVTKKDGKAFRASSGQQLVFTKIKSNYTYNQHGQMIKRNDVYSDKPGLMNATLDHFKKTIYEYDTYGSLVMKLENFSTRFSEIGSVLTTFKYEYDSNGNWITKKTYINDILTTITTREITYWD